MIKLLQSDDEAGGMWIVMRLATGHHRRMFDTIGLVPLVWWLAFLLVQMTHPKETPLTLLAGLMAVAVVASANIGEQYLFLFGLGLGLAIEVGMGLVTRIQHWEDASLMGVPAWLPLIWGIGLT